MNHPIPMWRHLRGVYVLSLLLLTNPAFLASGAPGSGKDASRRTVPSPTPWVFSHPLRSEALFASGYAAPWLSAASAWVSGDGRRVAFFSREPASAEGISRTLVVKEVDTDAVVFEKTLFSEQESLQQGTALERLARSRAQEALTSLSQDDWVPLAQQDLSEHEREFFSDACFEKQFHPKRSATLESLKVTYQEPRVQVWRRGKKVFDRRFADWRLKQEQCPRASPSWLNRAFGSSVHGVVLLELGFCGADLCPESATAFHALRIPGGKPRAGASSITPSQTPPPIPTAHYERAGEAWQTLYVTGFPAISTDGSRVALAEVRPDAGRGSPNLLITIRRPQTNEVLWKSSLLDAEESASMKKATPLQRQALDRTVMERIRVVNEQLHDTPWVPLVEQAVQPVVSSHCPVEAAQTVRLSGVEVIFHQGHITRSRDGASLPGELILPALDVPESAACDPARGTFIDTAYSDPTQTTVVLRLATCVDDACPTQVGRYHVLQFPE